jgi:hypothetical protein
VGEERQSLGAGRSQAEPGNERWKLGLSVSFSASSEFLVPRLCLGTH